MQQPFVIEQKDTSTFTDNLYILNRDSQGVENKQPPLDVNNNIRLLIGEVDQRQQPHQHYQKLLSEVRLWNTARSLAQIFQSMHVKLREDKINLVGYW